MKILNLLGKRVTIKIEDSKPVTAVLGQQNKKAESFLKKHLRNMTQSINGRVLFIILLVMVFIGFSKIKLVDMKYKEGDSVKKDIIAPISIEYKDNIKIEQIIREIEKTTKVYRRDYAIEEQVLKNVDDYFENIAKFDLNMSQEDFIEFINETGVTLAPEHLKTMLIMEPEKREELKERIKIKLQDIFNRGYRVEKNSEKDIPISVRRESRRIEIAIILEFLKQNDIYDARATQESIKQRIEAIGDIKERVRAGEIVLKKGDIVKKSDIVKLEKLGIYSYGSNIKLFIGIMIYCAIVAVCFFILIKKYAEKEILNNKIYNSTVIYTFFLFLFAVIFMDRHSYMFPAASSILLLGIIAKERYAIIYSVMAILLLNPIFGFNEKFMISGIVGTIVGVCYIKSIKNRTNIVNAGFAIGIAQFLAGLAYGVVFKEQFMVVTFNMVELMVSGIAAGMITIAVLPYFENTFNILTDIKLLELGDFSHPLLRELLLKAPGTFHHSIIVATLAESACESIGANSTFARVASYYHDIGKTKRPKFFVENQVNKENPHLKMNPYLSTIIITAHTKDGDEMARKYKVPKEIRDVMKEHQGTTLLAYFYNAVKKENPEANEEDFRYEGPKPRTKESAVIMLADSIEAAVRSLEDKNSVEIENMVRKIINMKMDDGQLSEAELTFKDIEIIINTFLKVFQGIYHSRIKYPDMKK